MQPPSSSSQNTRGATYKSLISFSVDHEDPGALARVLSVFGTHGISLTSINARPSGEQNWHYVFLVEFTGGYWSPQSKSDGKAGDEAGNSVQSMIRQPQDVDEGDAVAGALKELGTVVKEWKWLGCWQSRA